MSYQSGSSTASPPVSAGSSSGQQEEFTVRIPRDNRKKFTMMKFRSGANVDFSKLGEQSVKVERENNLKEYKTANDLDLLPKFGAGSEYGRDMKEESRRKKYGIMLKKYNPEDQPWLLKIGSGKQAKKYKGVREGTISENTSYYVFTKATDGAFEAYPVEQWYNFSPTITYKYLNSEEAEQEYNRRHKNYFNIMQKYKVKTKEDDNADEDADQPKGSKKKKKKSDLVLTDMDEWDDFQLSDEDDRDDDEDDEKDDDDGAKSKKKKKKPVGKGKKKSGKQNSDDEAVEESDEGDYDDREVDYMSSSGSESSLSGPEEDAKEKKYDEKGVDQEDGLRNILDSGEEDEEENQEKEDIDDDVLDKDGNKEDKKKGDGNSSSSSSEDDSDIEKEAKLASDLLMPDDKPEKKEKVKPEPSTSESAIKQESVPPPVIDKHKVLKRKAEKSPEGKAHTVKKQKSGDIEGISEDAIRRYLIRKPMTTKDLFLKFKSKKLKMSNEKITHVIAQLLKKINPDKSTINKKLYLSLKKPE